MRLRRAAFIGCVLVVASAACSPDSAEEDDSIGSAQGRPAEHDDVAGSPTAATADESASVASVGHAGSGRYAAVAAGSRHTCALRTDRTVVCWGINNTDQIDAPSGEFTALSAGRRPADPGTDFSRRVSEAERVGGGERQM